MIRRDDIMKTNNNRDLVTDTACTTGIDLIRGIVLVILPKPDKVRELLDLSGNGPSQNHRQL